MAALDEPELPPWPEAQHRIEVSLRTTIFFGGQAAPLVRVGVAPQLFVYASLAGRLIRGAEATRWGRPFSEIVAAGLTNLAERPPELVGEGPVLRLEAEDGRAAARVLLPGLLDAVLERVGRRIVCGIPDPETCLLAGDEDPHAVVELFDRCAEAWHESDAPVSPVVYAATPGEGTIRLLELPPSHPAFDRARRAEALLLATVYGDQRASLLEAGATDEEIAPFEVAPHEDLGVVTATIALAGVAALLPRADLVMLRWGDGLPDRLVPLELLEQERFLLELPDHDPPRLALARFPTPAEAVQMLGEADQGR